MTGRFHWDWKTGRMKDTYSDCHATKNMRLIERQINDACRRYEKQIAELEKENEQLQKENNKLHQKIFEMRTNIALDRTEISRQTYTGKKNEKEYLDAKEFLDEIEKW